MDDVSYIVCVDLYKGGGGGGDKKKGTKKKKPTPHTKLTVLHYH